MSGSGISWAICKSAPRSRQITTPAPHHSVFLQAGCPSCHPTNSVKALKAKLVQKKKLIKTSAVFNTPGKSNVKLITTCVAIWFYRKVTADVNSHSIHNFQVELMMYENLAISLKNVQVLRFTGIFNSQNNNKSFSPLCIYDLNTQARRVIFGVSKTLSNFRHNILLKKNKTN